MTLRCLWLLTYLFVKKKIEKKKAFQAEDFNKVKHQISSLSTKQKE